ncbi:hypothetical protein BDV95DRAFT_488999 [Massariosphaeria phaeospora]|uniref:25S rRNA (Uridine(2843)-N(3))-methyltransferase n=1 Tax=Massariosphaeria phaeospora TaxID=100035 RepID=A0A7C8IDL8_9PLEO|nr:hypothetical protein BDV95DRAFT_488999 [Massariosphaeria phaeospora]
MAPQKSKSATKPAKKPVLKSVGESLGQEQISPPPVPVKFLQPVLDIFRISLSERLLSDFQPLLQEVKGHLYNRDFVAAFGKEEYLETYAARWSPSRALAYLQVFADLKEHLVPSAEGSLETDVEQNKIVCLGGGAGAEIVALAGFLSQLHNTETGQTRALHSDVVAIDIANWSAVVENLKHNITTAPPVSQYASAAAQAANLPLASRETFHASFHQHDILTTDFSVMQPLFQDARLVTLMFTLNELYSTSRSRTQNFLLNLTGCARPGSLLLVVDSPGSYSAVSLNGAKKRYPMQWLVDHALLRDGAKEADAAWEKIVEDESRWFRLLPTLRYPIELENMRFQMHLYRRL